MSDVIVDIIIEPDGSLLIERGTKEQNNILLRLLEGNIKDPEALRNFMSMADDTEIIDGGTTLCG